MPLDVNNVFVTVDEDQITPNNDTDEVASFTPTYNASLAAAVAAITTAAPTTAFGTTQIAAQDNFFTIGADTNDLRFVQNLAGTAFPTAGPGVDSGLKTADGTSIYLYQSATTDNVIYGAIGNVSAPGNPAAFIIVLDEQLSGADVTNAKLWILQYAALQHDDQNVVEGDIVDLLNKVFVASSGTVEAVFSDFSDVPAGSPIFAMIADDTNANPIDFLVTAYQDGAKGTGIQLNVSNQGSFPGSLASGSQNISYGTALRFDLVTDGVNTYTQSEGQSDTAIAFDTHQNVTQAGFAIVQNQGNRPTDLKIELWDSLSDTADGHNFFTSVLNEASVAIDKILVGTIDPDTGVITPLFDSSDPADASHFVFSGNAITVLDLGLNYVVNIFQDSGFDRFTALNVTTTTFKGDIVPDTNAFVDIGRLTFTTTSPTADVDEVGSRIQVDDSGPTIAIQGTVAALDVDDSGLAGGTNVGVGLTDTVNVAANFTSTTGADGAGAVGYTMKVVNGTDSGLDDVATGDSILLRLNGSGVVEGYLQNHTTDVAFTVGVDSSGTVTLTHLRAIKHAPGGVDETASAIAADAIKVTGTITDTEGVPTGDTASVDLPIGDLLNFHDDEPTVTAQDSSPNTLIVDDDLLGAPGAASASFAALFTKVYGADGPDPVDDVVYSLSTTDGPSGVFDVASDLEVQLKTTAGVVHGYVVIAAVETDVFTVSVNADTGLVTLTQQRAIKHTDVPPADDASQDPTNLTGTDLIKLTATIKDKDGDTANDTADITAALQFNDGQPSITAGTATADSLSVDDDLLGAPGAASASFAASFTKNFGPDGAAAANDTTYAMTTSGGGSGVFDVATGLEVQLKLDTGVVHGYVTIAAVDVDVFTVSVDANGLVTLTQQRAIQHTDVPPADDASQDPTNLTGANKIGVVATVTDKDGDTDAATLDITQTLEFNDGQPSITGQAATPDVLSVDDDLLGAPGADSVTFASLFTKDFGPDGAAALNDTVYSLTTAGGASGIFDVATDQEVQLKLDGGVVHGYITIAAVDTDVFTVSVNSATAEVTLTQQRAIRHVDTGTLTDASEDPTNLVGTDLIGLVATVTDKDGDTDAATVDLTQTLEFNDDQPAITVTPSPGDTAGTALQVTNAAGEDATGNFGFDIGADKPAQYGSGVSDFVDANAGVAGVQLSLSGTVTGPPSTAITNTSVTLASEDADDAVFNFSFDYDKDPNTAGVQTGTATGTLSFDKAADTYTVAITSPVVGFSFNVLHTNELLAKEPTGNTGHPPIVVEKLAQDDPATLLTDEDFYVQFTADNTPLGFSTTGDVSGSADKAFTGADHDLAGGVETWVSATQSTNGVAGDTIQKGELLTLRFFSSDILGDVASGTEKTAPTQTADGVVLKFDGIGANEDLILILDLKDVNGGPSITRAVVVENGDIFKHSDGVPAPYNTEFSLDNNDGLVILESNDYNAAGEHYEIQGIQIMQSPNGLTGQGIDLTRAVGTNGGSSTTSGLQSFAGNVNDVLKIVDIGFVQSDSGTQDAHLDFSFQINDADGDLTTTQHLFVDFLTV